MLEDIKNLIEIIKTIIRIEDIIKTREQILEIGMVRKETLEIETIETTKTIEIREAKKEDRPYDVPP